MNDWIEPVKIEPTVFVRSCPVCAASLNVMPDGACEDVKLRPENLPPLVKDKLAVVSVYKGWKNLGAQWEKLHGARAIIYAGNLLEAVGFQGGQLERAIALMGWLQTSGKDWSLDTAPRFFAEYERAQKETLGRGKSRCTICAEEFSGSGQFCPRHQGID